MHACGDARAPIPPHPQASSPLILLPLPLYAFAFNRCDSTTPASLSPPLDLPVASPPRLGLGLGRMHWRRRTEAAACSRSRSRRSRSSCVVILSGLSPCLPPRLVPVPALTEKKKPNSYLLAAELIPSRPGETLVGWIGNLGLLSSSRMIGVALALRGRPAAECWAGATRERCAAMEGDD